MHIVTVMALYNYKVLVIIYKKKLRYSVSVKHGKTFKIFSRTFQDPETKFKDFLGQEKKSRTFPECGNPVVN